MRKLTKRLLSLAAALVLVFSLSTVAYALDFTREDGYSETTDGIPGIKVTTTTDKNSYSNGDKITYTLTIENTSGVDIGNVTLRYTIDGNLSLGKQSEEIDLIKAGETKVLTVTTSAISGGGPNIVPIIIAVIVAVCVIVIAIILIVMMKKKKAKNAAVSSILILAMVGSMFAFSAPNVKADETNGVTSSMFSRVSVHDPSIVWDFENEKYYIFGSHRAWASSSDLMSWKTFTNNINSDYRSLFENIWNNFSWTEANNDVSGNCWAPDVIYNEEMKKWCMYMSINGNDWHSAIVLLTADNIEGPYTYVDEVVFSGVDGSTSATGENVIMKASKAAKAGSDTYTLDVRISFSEVSEAITRYDVSDYEKVLGADANLSRYSSTDLSRINAIDPCVTYDENGDLWMTYGSWSAGIYQLKLDTATGLRDYDYKYETVTNVSDEYLGYKIAGGFYNSGEGAYILSAGDYYYLFISYGNLEASGGYQMRIYRSESINGPYVDMNGQSSIFKSWLSSVGMDGSSKASKYGGIYGLKLFGSYDMYGMSDIQVAQGHNSAIVDEKTGEIFLVYHSRFANAGEGHSVRVHQMFINEDGWLVATPYEYSGEQLPTAGYSNDSIVGTYDFVLHAQNKVYTADDSTGVIDAVTANLNADGTISGDVTGTWKVTTGANVAMTIDGVEYSGVFIEQANELTTRDQTMTFTLAGGNKTAWGVKTK